MSDMARLSVNMTPETAAQLRAYADDRHLTYTEAVRRAIAIAAHVESEHAAGRRIQTVDVERNEVRELIFT